MNFTTKLMSVYSDAHSIRGALCSLYDMFYYSIVNNADAEQDDRERGRHRDGP